MSYCKIVFSDNEDSSFLTDATLLTEDGWSFDVHRTILVKESVFLRMLFRNFKDDSQEFLVPHIKGCILNLILVYIYTSAIPIKNENISELFIAADYLQVDKLVLYIMNNMSVENCMSIYMSSLKINADHLIKLSYRFIQTNFEAVVCNNAADFVDISFDSLKQLLSDNNLRVQGEHVVWSSIVKWVLNEPRHRLCKVYDLLTCLKIAEIDDSLASEIIRSDVVSKNSLFENLEINDVENNVRNSLNVLKHIFQNSSPVGNFHCLRRPKCLHLIVRSYECNVRRRLTYNTLLYITYDENIDIWRQFDEKHCALFFLLICGHTIYMFDSFKNIFVALNLITSRMYEIRLQSPEFFVTSMVTHGNNIICIGIEDEDEDEEEISLKFYNTGNGRWFNGPHLENFNAYFAKAVLYQNQVYIVGPAESSLSMKAQIYNTESNSLSNFTPPMIYRMFFEFTEYHGKLFVIGGCDESFDLLLNKVEVFDPETSTWILKSDLPFSYFRPKATVFNGQLIVYDKNEEFIEINWPVVWNETEEKWQPVERPLGAKDIQQYKFITIDNSEVIDALTRENRKPYFVFEKSPFT